MCLRTNHFESSPSPSGVVSATTHGVITIATNKSPTRKSCIAVSFRSADSALASEHANLTAIGDNLLLG